MEPTITSLQKEIAELKAEIECLSKDADKYYNAKHSVPHWIQDWIMCEGCGTWENLDSVQECNGGYLFCNTCTKDLFRLECPTCQSIDYYCNDEYCTKEKENRPDHKFCTTCRN